MIIMQEIGERAVEINLDKNKIKRILIIKIAAIGDLLLITPAVRAIKKSFPQARITLLVGTWSRQIIEGNPNIDEIIEVPDEIFFRIRPFSLLSLIWKIRKEHFDMVFVWHRSMAFRFFSWLLRIKRRVGFSRNKNGSFLTHYVEENPEIHEILEYQSTLKPLGIESSEIDMDLVLSDVDQKFADDLWKEHGISDKDLTISIAPAGAKNPKEIVPLKHWLKEYYAEVSDVLIHKKNAKVIFVGNKDDSAVINEILSRMKGKAIDLSGKTNLKQAAAVIKRCSLFIGNDSAPMHIAAALKTPVVSLFGPTNPRELAPLDYNHKYLFAEVECSPCYRNGRFPNCKTKNCMKEIKPAEVSKTVDEILNS